MSRGSIASRIGGAVLGMLLVCAGCGKEDPEPPSAAVEAVPTPFRLGDRTAKRPTDGGSLEAPTAGPGPRAAPSRPASQPESPQAGSAGGTVPPFTPLEDAVEGEWALYSGSEGCELRYLITRTGGSGATVQVTVRERGQPLGQPALREEPPDFDPLIHQAGAKLAERRMTPAKIQAAGRVWDALLYEDRWIDEEIRYVRRTWVSREAPVYGMLRMELRGDEELEARLELKAFGRSGGKTERWSDGEMER